MLDDYQNFVITSWNRGSNQPLDFRDLYIMTAGLGGETGEVLEWLKKNVRDGNKDYNDLKLELGDVLYYLTMIANKHGFALEDIMLANMQKLKERRKKYKKEILS